MACITPFQKTDKKAGQYISVPCGKCPECLKRRASGWSFRLMQQDKISNNALFVTLTYDTEHVPLSRNGFMTLDKTDVQKFFKRLRFHLPPSHPKISYYVAGEYGGKNNRPHYHAIIFNAFSDDITAAWCFPPRDQSTKESTPAGNIVYGDVNGASVGYTLKYMCKKRKIPMHRNDDRIPEFSLMSKGLGANYLTPAMVRYHKNDLENRMNCVLPDGKVIAMPRYYKDKVYTEQERKIIAWHAIRENIEREIEYQKAMQKLHGQNWRSIEIQNHLLMFKKMHNDADKNRHL